MADRSTPQKDGFFAPAEWAPHSHCIVGWPWRQELWPCKGGPVHKTILAIIRCIIEHGKEDVILLTHPSEPAYSAEDMLEVSRLCEGVGQHRLQVWLTKMDRSSMRDRAPTFVISKSLPEVRGVAWKYSGYGFRYGRSVSSMDSTIAKQVCQRGGYQCYESEVMTEGGALAFNGAGTVITTESVLLDKRRNAGWLKEDVEQELKEYLGCQRVIWLEKGLPYDQTGGHVDNLAAFVHESEVVLAWIDEDRDPELHRSLIRAKATLEKHGLKVHKLHLPDQPFRTADEMVPALQAEGFKHYLKECSEFLAGSYVNFYIANQAVIVPLFNQRHWDKLALHTLEDVFRGSGRKVVGVLTRDLLVGGGNIHCFTQHVPQAYHHYSPNTAHQLAAMSPPVDACDLTCTTLLQN